MNEIEVKARVTDRDKLEAAMQAMGIVLEPPLSQHDRVYIDPSQGNTGSGRNILRIRKQGQRAIFTLKVSGVNELHSLEHETEVKDPEVMHRILGLLGYQLVIEIKKTRQKAHYQDLEICLDQVESLGSYVEVERLLEKSDDPEQVQEELYQFLESLGVGRNDRETRGYDTLVHLKEEGKL